jgi:hypothetical protein
MLQGRINDMKKKVLGIGIFVLVIALLIFRFYNFSNTNNIPRQEEIFRRTLCLGVLLKRFEIEKAYQDVRKVTDEAKTVDKKELEKANLAFEKSVQEMISDLNKWILTEQLDPHFSLKEKTIMSKKLGFWSKQDLIDSSWRKESLGILLWSLSMIEKIPEYDTEFDEETIMKIVFDSPVDKFRKSIKLRTKKEIQTAREIAEHWHWRSRTTQVIEEGNVTPPAGLTFDKIIENSAEGGYKEGFNQKPIEGDFPVLNKAYKALTDVEYSVITSIAMERHFSLNWLSGYSNDWDSTPTDT